MKGIFRFLIIVCFCWGGCVESKVDNTPHSEVPVKKKVIETDYSKMSARQLLDTYYIPPYLRASFKRHLYDTCIFKQDTMVFRGEKYSHRCYYLFPSLELTHTANFIFSVYSRGDSTWVWVNMAGERIYLRDSPDEVTFFNVDKDEVPFYTGFESVEEILSLFDKAGELPVAEFDREGIIKGQRGPNWRCRFKKIFREDGLKLQNPDYPQFKFFIRYPYRFREMNKPVTRRDRAKMLPPWLFWDFSDYFCYFSTWGCVGVEELPDFSNFPGADTSSLKPIRSSDAYNPSPLIPS